VYFMLYVQRPVFGWTFEGFDMPNPLVNWWPAHSGQHFHEGYMEMLFYLGAVGLLLKYSFLFYLLYKMFSKKLSEDSIILISFCLSGLIFSFSYVLPTVFWGVVGVCLYYIEKKPASEEEDGGIQEPVFNLIKKHSIKALT
jgi:O-antigen ligase